MIQIIVILILFLIIAIPVGNYMYKVTSGKKIKGDFIFDKVDEAIYKVCGINKEKEMNWKEYAIALFFFFSIMILIGYLIFRI